MSVVELVLGRVQKVVKHMHNARAATRELQWRKPPITKSAAGHERSSGVPGSTVDPLMSANHGPPRRHHKTQQRVLRPPAERQQTETPQKDLSSRAGSWTLLASTTTSNSAVSQYAIPYATRLLLPSLSHANPHEPISLSILLAPLTFVHTAEVVYERSETDVLHHTSLDGFVACSAQPCRRAP